MTRDFDLIRRILLHLERDGDKGSPSGFSSFADEGYAPEAIHYHIRLLHDAGLIEADEIVPGQWWPERMTWAGHEFLDAARNEALWRETKKKVEKSAGSAPFLLVHDLLIQGIRKRVEKRRASSPRKRRR